MLVVFVVYKLLCIVVFRNLNTISLSCIHTNIKLLCEERYIE